MLCSTPSSARWLPALGLCGLLVACGSEVAAGHRPDVVLISLDTVRSDALGPFSQGRAAATPFLDELAAQSVVFTNAWTGSTWTAPSMATVFTGVTPQRHGLIENLWVQVGQRRDERGLREYMSDVSLTALPTALRTLPEHLKSVNFQTVGVGTNPNICEDFGFTRGFDQHKQHSDLDAAEAVDLLLDMAAGLDPGLPRFFHLHLNDAHTPYQSRVPWCSHVEGGGCSNECRYQSEISYLDSQLRRLFETLELGQDAIVIVVSDHGEEFNDHGEIGHRYSVHQELSRASLMVKAPGLASRRSDLPAHHIDVLPTLLQLLDMAPPEDVDGIALATALDDAGLMDRPVATHRIGGKGGRELWGTTMGRWRLIEELPDGVVRLYDTQEDRLERNDLSASRPDLLAELQERSAELRASMVPLPRTDVRVDMTDELTEDLIKLGYAGEQH